MRLACLVAARTNGEFQHPASAYTAHRDSVRLALDADIVTLFDVAIRCDTVRSVRLNTTRSRFTVAAFCQTARKTVMEFPDFHIPHTEKIEWMIETAGWAYEAVSADAALTPPQPACGYTIGLPDLVNYPDIILFGLTPSAGHGLLQMIVGLLLGGTELPVGPELLGVLDNDLRCRFAPLDETEIARRMPVAVAWYQGVTRPAVQLLYPDRYGVLPYEDGFEQRMRLAQPVVGDLTVDLSIEDM